ncbi:MAG: PilZ domain-containing protein [Myxococcota bacterium]
MASRDRRAKERRKDKKVITKDRRAEVRRTGKDRREEIRVPLELWMEEVSGDDVYFRRTGNVSIGGVYFDRAIPHSLGTEVTLKFALPGDKEMVVARGQVVSAAGSNDGLGMGVKFISVEGDGQKRIRSYIRAL